MNPTNGVNPVPEVSLIKAGTDANWRRRGQWIGWIVGSILLFAAVTYIVANRASVIEALQALDRPDPLLLALLGACVVGNVIVTAAIFSLLFRRFGRVGAVEMQALIAATTLMNFLPLRPGFFGRIAYLRAVRGIDLHHGVRVSIEAMAIGGATALATALVLAAAAALQSAAAILFGAVCAASSLGLLFAPTRIFAGVVLLRFLDIAIWAARYFILFELLGHPISADGALAFAAVGMVAMMVPFSSNGLGLREWAIGLSAPLLVVDLQSEVALTADLLNRAAELVIIGICGGFGLAYLAARRKRREAPGVTA